VRLHRVLAILCVAPALGPPFPAYALTPTQAAIASARAHGPATLQLQSAASSKARSLNLSKERMQTIEHARTIVRSKAAVQAETLRRTVAATKAAQVNAAIRSAMRARPATAMAARAPLLGLAKQQPMSRAIPGPSRPMTIGLQASHAAASAAHASPPAHHH
jgi:hypothetical protein